MTTCTISSRWTNTTTNQTCTIKGTKKTGDTEYTFRITGWNPLPCKSFKGTYKILADWLSENGWARVRTPSTYDYDVVQITREINT